MKSSPGMVRTVIRDAIPERTTPHLSFRVVDDEGQTVTSLDTLAMTIHMDGSIINSRDKANVLPAFSNGFVSIHLEAGDTAVLATSDRVEVHTALFEWSWDGGQRHGKHEIIHTVMNLLTVP